MVDSWWNAAVESQAFHRIIRIGQKKEMYIARIVVEDSIDEKVLAIQERKLLKLANTSKEYDVNSYFMNKPSGGDMMELLELTKWDESGMPVLPEDDKGNDFEDDDSDHRFGPINDEEQSVGDCSEEEPYEPKASKRLRAKRGGRR
jgi:hypothetical protein